MRKLSSLISAWGILIFCQVGHSVSDEERKAVWNSPSPRGAKSSPSKSSGNLKSSATSGSTSNSTNQFSYNDLSANFDKELKKSTEDFTKSLPKIDEKNFLKEMEEATKSLGNSKKFNGNSSGTSVESSLLSQYTAAVISTIEQTTQIQLDLIARQKRAMVNQENQKARELAQQEKADRMQGLSPMAITLGAAEVINPRLSQQTSPLSTRTQGRHGSNAITSRAYKSPE